MSCPKCKNLMKFRGQARIYECLVCAHEVPVKEMLVIKSTELPEPQTYVTPGIDGFEWVSL